MPAYREPKIAGMPERDDDVPPLPSKRPQTSDDASPPATRSAATHKRWVSASYYAHDDVPIAPFGVGFPRPIVHAPHAREGIPVANLARWTWAVLRGHAPGVYVDA